MSRKRVEIGRTGRIVRDVSRVGEDGRPIKSVCRFLRHVLDSGGSPNAAAAHGYDLKYLFEYLSEAGVGWEASSFGVKRRWPRVGLENLRALTSPIDSSARKSLTRTVLLWRTGLHSECRRSGVRA